MVDELCGVVAQNTTPVVCSFGIICLTATVWLECGALVSKRQDVSATHGCMLCEFCPFFGWGHFMCLLGITLHSFDSTDLAFVIALSAAAMQQCSGSALCCSSNAAAQLLQL